MGTKVSNLKSLVEHNSAEIKGLKEWKQKPRQLQHYSLYNACSNLIPSLIKKWIINKKEMKNT